MSISAIEKIKIPRLNALELGQRYSHFPVHTAMVSWIPFVSEEGLGMETDLSRRSSS